MMARHSIEIRLRIERKQVQQGTTADIVTIEECFDATCPAEEDARIAVDIIIDGYIERYNLPNAAVTVEKIDVMPVDERE